jgi:hypothetical protein
MTTGWISFYIRRDEDTIYALQLLKIALVKNQPVDLAK